MFGSLTGNRFRDGLVLLLAASLLTLPGCGGCRPDKAADPADEDLEKAKEEFTSAELKVLPTDDTLAAYGLKPGHWYSVHHRLKANKSDFYGELNGFTGERKRLRHDLARSPFQLLARRPVVLPKGQGKTFEVNFFVPHAAARRDQVWLYSDLALRYRGTTLLSQSQIVNRLRPYQNFFVVLARRPDAYGFVKSLGSVLPPSDGNSLQPVRGDYVPVLPIGTRQVPLPSWDLMWTSVAYILWDDFDASILTPAQQRAFVTWLNWGGQLIISGPESLDGLRSTFLSPFLPAEVETHYPITAESVSELDRYWSVRSKVKNVDPKFPLRSESSIELVELKLRPGSEFVPRTGNQLAERRVGRGRVVVTSFPMTSREFITWRRFDNFFNACVLRRPPRKYSYTDANGLTNVWTDEVVTALHRRPARETIPNLPVFDERQALPLANEFEGRRFANESLVTSRMRFFSRDGGLWTRV